MMNGADVVRKAKKNTFGLYLRVLDCMDPQLAGHLLKSQRELFLAGQRFFEGEVRHAEKAINKMERKQGTAEPAPETPKVNIEVVSH